jgi:chromosome partitioning protein
VFGSIKSIQAGPNPELRFLGLVLSMVQPRLGIHQLYEQSLRTAYGPSVFTARVPVATDIKESVARRKPVALHKPRCASTKAYRALAEEIQARITGTNETPSAEAA